MALPYYTSTQGADLAKRVKDLENGGDSSSSDEFEAEIIADSDGCVTIYTERPLDMNSLVQFHDLDKDTNMYIAVGCYDDVAENQKRCPSIFISFITDEDDIDPETGHAALVGFSEYWNKPQDLDDEDHDLYTYVQFNEFKGKCIEGDPKSYYEHYLEIDQSGTGFNPGDRVRVSGKLTNKGSGITLH